MNDGWQDTAAKLTQVFTSGWAGSSKMTRSGRSECIGSSHKANKFATTGSVQRLIFGIEGVNQIAVFIFNKLTADFE